jgi:hypothetical protein
MSSRTKTSKKISHTTSILVVGKRLFTSLSDFHGGSSLFYILLISVQDFVFIVIFCQRGGNYLRSNPSLAALDSPIVLFIILILEAMKVAAGVPGVPLCFSLSYLLICEFRAHAAFVLMVAFMKLHTKISEYPSGNL